ncbi:Hypothetical protein, putative [Bodo saltans]|uniref:PSI domain-containing protein n=1 Tax=Bodo saltans TaxID=75058 RepID=A0A0S4ISQ4_BODSA|nr:Hypothetical protein, putative [Bodo saltans]|eukprot:CUE90585.1 Hypothetical protein, putative [Bodo saltans]
MEDVQSSWWCKAIILLMIVLHVQGDCSGGLSCSSCTSLDSCGWCTATSTCESGNETSSFGSCPSTSWVWYGQLYCPTTPAPTLDCRSYATSCSLCTSTGTCGWCSSNNQCLAIDVAGGPIGNCSNASSWRRIGQCPSTVYCGSYGSCSSCTSVASCGWCTQQWSNTSSSQCQEVSFLNGSSSCTASYFIELPGQCPSICPSIATCRSCLLYSGCGWCAATNQCQQGNNSTKSSQGCTAPDWSMQICPPTNCSTLKSCSTCGVDVCGWCSSTNTCQIGNSTMGVTGCTSRDWAWYTSRCPVPNSNCSLIQRCSACMRTQDCGWCAATSRCEKGNATRGISGCQAPDWDWVLGNCTSEIGYGDFNFYYYNQGQIVLDTYGESSGYGGVCSIRRDSLGNIVASNYFYQTEASTVCSWLGFSARYAMAMPTFCNSLRGYFPRSLISNLSCSANITNINDCTFEFDSWCSTFAGASCGQAVVPPSSERANVTLFTAYYPSFFRSPWTNLRTALSLYLPSEVMNQLAGRSFPDDAASSRGWSGVTLYVMSAPPGALQSTVVSTNNVEYVLTSFVTCR